MNFRTTSLLIALASSALTPAAVQAWTKSYVVEWMAPAFYYGAPANGNEETPGTDCPNGVTPGINWSKELVKSYRSKEETAVILNPEYTVRGNNRRGHFGFRGPLRDNIYENPTANSDPGLVEVAGNIAYGLDLDDNPATGFTSPDGVKGVDNAYYRVAGCTRNFRGAHLNAGSFKGLNDRMRNGARTVVMVLSGDKDPMNDDDVSVGIYSSHDHIVKDANGEVAPYVTFSVDPKHQTVFKAKITSGVLESVERPKMHFEFSVRHYGERYVTDLYNAKIKLEISPDGSMKGIVGGYRKFFEHYAEMTNYGGGAAAGNEDIQGLNMPGFYYSLRRNADGLKDPETGANMGISSTYHLYLVPAFVMTPDSETAVEVAQSFK